MCVIVQIIYVVAYQGCIDAWVRIQHGGAVAISFYTADDCSCHMKRRSDLWFSDCCFLRNRHSFYLRLCTWLCHCSVYVYCCRQYSCIQPAVVVCIWEKYFTVTFTEEPGIVQITCSITIYIGWIKLYLWYKMVYNKACDAY